MSDKVLTTVREMEVFQDGMNEGLKRGAKELALKIRTIVQVCPTAGDAVIEIAKAAADVLRIQMPEVKQ